jgi:trans-aconitate 2-methyltransferase
MRWDPDQYSKFADERGRPFRELLGRVESTSPGKVIDLGCGPGGLTTLLADRWPTAEVVGIDSSVEMIDRANARRDSRVRFELGDISTWSPPGDVDVVITNAALQWVPGHRNLLPGWLDAMSPDSWLAVQVPGNFSSPSHTLMRALAESPRWAAKVGSVLRPGDSVGTADEYARVLLSAGWSADVWQTTYTHVLSGSDPVLEWLRGTGLRPVLAALDERDPSGADRRLFEAEYGELARGAYPPTGSGLTLLEYRRIFAVGHKPA